MQRLVHQTLTFPASFFCPGRQPRFTACSIPKSKEGEGRSCPLTFTWCSSHSAASLFDCLLPGQKLLQCRHNCKICDAKHQCPSERRKDTISHNSDNCKCQEHHDKDHDCPKATPRPFQVRRLDHQTWKDSKHPKNGLEAHSIESMASAQIMSN